MCVYTWAGDGTVAQKGKNLGPQGSLASLVFGTTHGHPSREGNHHVIPLQAPAMVGLRYLNELANRGRISRPKVIT